MMSEKQSTPTRIAERLHEFMQEFAPKVAELRRPVLGNVPVSKDERRRRWWQTDPRWPQDPEQSRALEMRLLGYDPDGLPIPDAQGNPIKAKLTIEDVGLLKYPYREIDARAAGNGTDDRAMAKYAREMSELGPPDPEPLEAAAMAAQAGPAPSAAQAPRPLASDATAVPAPTMPTEGGSY